MAYWIMNSGPGGGWLMKRTAVMASSLAVTLVAGLFTGPASASPPAAAPLAASAIPRSVPTVWPAKKPARGVLRVKVTGTGSYTIRAKGFRKTGAATRTFPVKPGRYTVKAPGATVKPKKPVRVRKGKTTTVRVGFPKKTPTPGPTPQPAPNSTPPPVPVQPPASGPVSQWVEPGAEATVLAPGGYSISIPAGVVQERSLVTLTPQPPAEGTIPTVDVHIEGPWSGQVKVGVPLPAGATGAWPILVHDGADGARISSGEAVSLSTVDGVPVVSASVSSLSQFQSWDQVVCQSMTAEDRAASYLCANNRDQTFQQWFRNQAEASGARLGKDGGAREHPCHYSGGTAQAVGTIPFGVSCNASMEGQTGRFAFTNNFHGEVLGWSSGAVYGLSSHGGEVSRTTDLPADTPWLLRPIAEAASGGTLVPAATVKYDKPLNSAETSLVINANLAATGAYQGMQLLAGQLGDKALAAGAGDAALVTKFGSCASNDLNDTVADCFTDAVKQLLGSDAVGHQIGADGAYMLKKVLRWADVGAYAESLIFAAAAWQPNPEVLLSNVTAIDPPTDRGGNDYIARDPGTGRSVRYYNGEAYDIANGGTFNCLALTRVVWDNPQLRALRQDPVGTATCDNAPRQLWTYTPTAQGGNTGTNIILRDSATPGHNWLINSAGEIQTIPDGGTYLCLAASNPVIWNTPDGNITAWTPVGGVPADCDNTLPDPPGEVSLVSSDSGGVPGNAATTEGAWSPDGTRMVFASEASNLVPNDTNGVSDVFVKTLATGGIQRISTDSAGNQVVPGGWSPSMSWSPVWSPDGTRIAFITNADNLVSGDTNNSPDVFVKTLATGVIQRVSTDSNGNQAEQSYFGAQYPDWSPDGTRIAFTSDANNLVPHDSDDTRDVFVKTLATGAIQHINTDASGNHPSPGPGTYGAHAPTWSPDSSQIAFCSDANELVPNDINSTMDVFVKTLSTGAIQRINTDANGTPPDHGPLTMGSCYPDWSPDGTKVAFASFATNLVPSDTNENPDVFIKTLSTGAIKRISTDSAGNQIPWGGWQGDFFWAPDGTRMVLSLGADNLVPSDDNSATDVFVKDIATGTMQRLSTDSEGNQIAAGAYQGRLSPDATRIAFTSRADDLVPNDTNSTYDIFVKALD